MALKIDKCDVYLVDKDKYDQKIEHYQNNDFDNGGIQKYISMYERYMPIAEKKLLSPFESNAIKNVEKLKKKFPNAGQVLLDIEAQTYLQTFNGLGYSKLNSIILLVGEAGCGKTSLANSILKYISPEFFRLNLSMFQESFQLSGLSMGYSSGGPGLIAQFIRNSRFANFFVLVDEFDKGAMESNSRTSAYIPMYQLLEKTTAKCFEDTALNLELDTSYISWIMTANDISLIPEALLSRCNIYNIRLPTQSEIYSYVAQSVWNDILEENNWSKCFNKNLSQKVRQELAIIDSPRKINLLLLNAAAYAAKRNSIEKYQKKISIIVDDLHSTKLIKNNKEIRMGFI